MTAFVKISDEGSVRHLTLDRPERLNAVPADAWDQLTSAFADFERSPLRVLVIRGAGGNFCAGADLGDEIKGIRSPAQSAATMRVVSAAAQALFSISKPTVAAVEGVAVGAGMNLALGCDIVLAAQGARFSEIFVRRGMTLDFGGSWILPRLVGLAQAKELALTGRMVEAEEAAAMGMIARVADDIDGAVTEIIQSLLGGAPLAQHFAKRALAASGNLSLAEALAAETQAQAICLVSDDVVEGVTAFLQKRSPIFKGR